MNGVIERRRHYLQLMRSYTLEKGYFTVHDIQMGADVPRSTAQDWVTRLYDEGCVILLEKPHGRLPAKYASGSALPSTTCRRIFTTVDGDLVEIYHDCMSSACAAFCAYHHSISKGPLIFVERDGTTLRECAHIGKSDVKIGLHPLPAVGITGVLCNGEHVIQQIRCTGGPAYSLTDMMSRAEGVIEVKTKKYGDLVEGCIKTKALVHLVIGIDDTDSNSGGATFALAIALLRYLDSVPGVYSIGHHLAMLYQGVAEKTGGNSCSCIDVGIEPDIYTDIFEKIIRFVADESSSDDWGVAVKKGFRISSGLREYGKKVRFGLVTQQYAHEIAKMNSVELKGARGVIGALAAVALFGYDNSILLNPCGEIPFV